MSSVETTAAILEIVILSIILLYFLALIVVLQRVSRRLRESERQTQELREFSMNNPMTGLDSPSIETDESVIEREVLASRNGCVDIVDVNQA